MSDTAARLVDQRLPIARYRQWVFSFPWRMRVALAKDGALLSRVLRVCMNKVFAHQRAKAKAAGIADGRTLGVSFVQRFGSLLQLNPHAHNVVPDGVFIREDTDVVEVSTTELDDVVRLEDRYGREGTSKP
jgi:hypothetical protein